MLADEVPYFLKKYFVKIATQRPLLSCEGVKTLKKHCRSPPPLTITSPAVCTYTGGGGGRGEEGGGRRPYCQNLLAISGDSVARLYFFFLNEKTNFSHTLSAQYFIETLA